MTLSTEAAMHVPALSRYWGIFYLWHKAGRWTKAAEREAVSLGGKYTIINKPARLWFDSRFYAGNVWLGSDFILITRHNTHPMAMTGYKFRMDKDEIDATKAFIKLGDFDNTSYHGKNHYII